MTSPEPELTRQSVYLVVEATMTTRPKLWIELANFDSGLTYAREYRDSQRELAERSGSGRKVRLRKVTVYHKYEEID